LRRSPELSIRSPLVDRASYAMNPVAEAGLAARVRPVPRVAVLFVDVVADASRELALLARRGEVDGQEAPGRVILVSAQGRLDLPVHELTRPRARANKNRRYGGAAQIPLSDLVHYVVRVVAVDEVIVRSDPDNPANELGPVVVEKLVTSASLSR
jgi:hypothetical protein